MNSMPAFFLQHHSDSASQLCGRFKLFHSRNSKIGHFSDVRLAQLEKTLAAFTRTAVEASADGTP
jgi:hypothetical protein